MSTLMHRPNITGKGRIIRAVGALLLSAGCLVAFLQSAPVWLVWTLGLSALFVWYESIRGWCVLRACGIKTRW